GYIKISACGSLTIGATGLVRCNGGNGGSDGTGNCGGGGAGSGGTVWLASPTVTNNGGVRAIGGSGGASNIPGPPYHGVGANGALGRIRVDGTISGSGNMVPANIFTGSALVVTASSNQTICAGNSVTMNASATGGTGTPTYVWNPGNIAGNTATVSPTTTTTYVVTATDGSGCTNTSSVVVTVNPLPVVTLGGNTALCPNDSVLLTGSPGGTSQWYLNGVAIANATSNTYMATMPGVYNMIQTSISACADSSAIGHTVVGVSAPVVALGNDITQCGGTIILDAQNAGSTFLWSTSVITQTISVSATGAFYVTVTDSNGCMASDTIIILINALPTLTFSMADTLCVIDGPSTLTANPAGGSFSGTGVNGNQFEPATAGVGMHLVTYTYTDSNACTASIMDSVLVDICLDNMTIANVATWSIYPNPSNGNFTLQTTVNGTVEVMNVLGEVVFSTAVKAGQVQTVELKNQAVGVYLVRFTHAHGASIERLVIE
ncbi:MAG: T9SS type A sorting domain-containing protein, partial [Bacteroidia bacterium]